MTSKEEIKQKEKQLLKMTKAFCSEKLNDEYSQLCEKLIKKMGQEKNVPFQRGKLEIWAAAVIHAIGSINFLFDKSFEPYVTVKEINDYFGTKNSTVSSKAREIREMFRLQYYDSEFSTQSMTDSNPFNDLVMVDGFIVPLDMLPENLQQEVRAARAKGEDIEFYTE